MLLDVRAIEKRYGGVHAVSGVTFGVAPGERVALIGPNGAGKSTLFNTIAGALPPTGGTITFRGQRIDGLRPDQIYARGIARTFQIPRPFGGMSVLENMMLAPKGQSGERVWNPLLRNRLVQAEERASREKAREILAFVKLDHLADAPARNLSGGQLKLLELGRTLMSDPSLILLDEPGAGVNPTLLGEIIERIAQLNARGVTFLIIEHNMDLVMNLCRPVVVMAAGKLLMEGEPEAVRQDPRVLEAYLGSAA